MDTRRGDGDRIIKAIETRYKGYRMRSRLEARWAVYFDAIGCRWEYEPEGFHLPDGTMYLPDFWLSSVNMWAEVKPEWPTDKEIQLAFLLAKGTGHAVLLLDSIPRQTNYWAIHDGLDEDATDGVIVHSQSPIWRDYLLTNMYLGGKHYENRFYCCTGGGDESWGRDRPNCYLYPDDGLEAVEAARSARFEHGESGSR